ncbi:hypothetical protein L9F63_006672, partial [Diploptera punctata]
CGLCLRGECSHNCKTKLVPYASFAFQPYFFFCPLYYKIMSHLNIALKPNKYLKIFYNPQAVRKSHENGNKSVIVWYTIKVVFVDIQIVVVLVLYVS